MKQKLNEIRAGKRKIRKMCV